MSKREKAAASIACIIIVVLLGIVIYQAFTIIKLQKESSAYSENKAITSSDDGKIVWINPDETVSTPDITDAEAISSTDGTSSETVEYVINKNSKKIHSPDCESAKNTLDKNKETVNWTESEFYQALDDGYSPCAVCKAGRE